MPVRGAWPSCAAQMRTDRAGEAIDALIVLNGSINAHIRVHQLVRSDACRTLAEADAGAGIENSSYLYRLYRERFGQMPCRNTAT